MTLNGDPDQLKVFAGRHFRKHTQEICACLGMPIAEGRTEVFPDGELLVTLEEDVRGRDCFVVLPTCSPVNDNLMELLIYADSLRRASARRITAVIPYFGYGRQDRKDRGRSPITAKLCANLITDAGYGRVLALDLHAAQIQGFFDLPVDHLAAMPVFEDYFTDIRERLGDLVVVSPDVGNVKIANMFAGLLGGDLAIVHKRRISGHEVTAQELVGEVKGRTALLVDDMISTGGTIAEAARVVMEHGASDVIAAATHAVFVGPAAARLAESPISKVVVTDSIPPDNRFGMVADRVEVLSIAELLASAIHHIHHNQSVSALFRRYAESKR